MISERMNAFIDEFNKEISKVMTIDAPGIEAQGLVFNDVNMDVRWSVTLLDRGGNEHVLENTFPIVSWPMNEDDAANDLIALLYGDSATEEEEKEIRTRMKKVFNTAR